MISNSSGVSRPGFCKIASGTATLPMSCSGLARYRSCRKRSSMRSLIRPAAAEFLGQRLRVIAHAADVLAGLRVARVGQLGQGEDGHVLRGGPLLGALLDELLQVVGVDFQLLLGGRQLPLHVAQAEVDADLGEQLVVVERLDDVVVGLGLVALQPFGGRALAGDEDHLDEAAQLRST